MNKETLSEALRLIGKRGGKARAKKLTPEELSAQGRRAGKASGKARRAKAKKAEPAKRS